MITRENLEQMSKYILAGMTEKESCLLTDISFEELSKLKENNEKVRDYIEKLKIKFKYNHLKEIQSKRSEKNSMWVLEKLIPQEFGSRSRGEAPTINIISQIIKDIQDDNQPIISNNRGRIIEVESRSETVSSPGSILN